MRPFEISILVLGLGALVCLFEGRLKPISRILAALSLGLLAAHLLFEGAHWQMLPAYLALLILCLGAWKPSGRPMPQARFWICAPALLLLLATAVLSWLLPMFRLPRPTGPYPVGTVLLYLKDSSRVEDRSPAPGLPRELMVQVWYPAQASSNRLARYREPRETNLSSSYQSVLPTNSRLDAPVAKGGAPFPVILFNHGWGSRRTNDTLLTEELASRGFVVASIDHTYNASLVAFPDGRVVHGNADSQLGDLESSTPQRVRAFWDKELAKQAADERFVLDRLEAMNADAGTRWYGRVNTHLSGAMGHSFGGAAATEVCALDPRVHAALNMDGWFFGAIRARGANQPLLYMNTTGDQSGSRPDPHAKVAAELGAEDDADLAASLERYGGFIVTLKGAEHADFTDQPLVSPLRRITNGGSIPAAELGRILRAYVVAFFDKTLRGADPAILHSGSKPFPEATLTVFPKVQQANAAAETGSAK